MGMDVHGLNPTSETGKYFRNNAWYWRPLANYIAEVAPSLYSEEVWQYNNGKGLDASDASALASILKAEVASGNCAAYATNYLRRIQSLPDEPCPHCNGTGHRNEHRSLLSRGDEFVHGAACNACEGKGHRRPSSTWYHFDVENVQAFANFCAASGGFAIW